MNITLEQASAFEAVARLGTIQNAAQELHKGHSAIVYLLKSLEAQTGLMLFDRSGHKNKMSLQGEIVLKYCQQLLSTKKELEYICQSLKGEWEPKLKIIYDGVINFNDIGDALFMLNEMKAPTEVKVLAAHLHEVQSKFEEEKADMMMTILPIHTPGMDELRMPPIRLLLVAHAEHALGKKSKSKLSRQRLNQHTFIKIRETGGLVGLSTEAMDFDSSFFVNDFHTKKLAILKKLGFGWLPDYLIQDELKQKKLVVLRGELHSEHLVEPRLYHRQEELLGKATRELLRFLKSRK